ncbi:HAD hydrolase family protein [Cytophagaceae bacterium ABcell3]|nr:HAD hydrolase family protein [Cytophagaceae bacterium ABcell3]
MKSVAIIPLRKGSKGIPGKNTKKLLGRSLYQWVLSEAIFSDLDEIYIFSDDPELKARVEKDYLWTDKVKFWERSKCSATDTASTEAGMLELAESLNYDFDIFCLLQATSPFTKSEDINAVLNKLKNKEADSVLTVVNSKRFIWSEDGESLNYKYMERPRRQDFQGLFIENGAVYAIKKDVYLETKNRLGGNIALVEMSEETFTEIDEPSDWTVVEQLLHNRLIQGKNLQSKTKALVLDVDGVFTGGNVLTGPDGELAKSFSLRDGMGFEIARENQLMLIVITSEDSPIVDRRMEKLKIENYYKGVKDKYALLDQICKINNIRRCEIAYVGDDINDLANMLSVNWSLTPNNAVEKIKFSADFVLQSQGGDKAIREAIEMILKINNRLK